MLPSAVIEQARHSTKRSKNPLFCRIDVCPELPRTNKFGDPIGDCLVCAIATAFDREYAEVEKDLLKTLTKIGFRNHASIEDFYLDTRATRLNEDWKQHGRARISNAEFIKTHKKGIYLLRNYAHITCVIDGICYDDFDSTKFKVYTAWEVHRK